MNHKITYQRRILKDKLFTSLEILAVILAIIPMASIIADAILKGLNAISISFLLSEPAPAGIAGGGIGPAIEGTAIMVGIAFLMAVPVGLGAGIYISEWPESRFSRIIIFFNDLLADFPSIIIGIFVYLIFVLSTGHFGALAGSIALSFIMIPIVARATEGSLKMVPKSIREASFALGIPKWKTIIWIVMSTGKAGLVTGIILAVARAAGETAPLLLTAGWSFHFATSLNQPIASIPYLIYYYGTSPYPDWQAQAWGAALILVFLILTVNIITRLLFSNKLGSYFDKIK